ncbi:hypothetical protein [Pararoseomonas baculiformis]|uniref:hypothetical protein n=1 Tax=Pararoseomonas baculiformis TaxID=2820812 RepID=UPI001ADF80F5|nr:hypothetical protein [Pararoseomonas baculiformis]
MEPPGNPGRFTPEYRRPFDLGSFVVEGSAIAIAIKAELPSWTVLYHDYTNGACACGDAVEALEV